MKKMIPAAGELKVSRIETMLPPINEPNIGIRLRMPVIIPNGTASPEDRKPKIAERVKTTRVVAQPLISDTVSAPVT